MLRCEGWDTFILHFAARHTDCVSDGENARIEQSDNISCISLIHDLTILRHHLLRLGQADLLAILHMKHFHACLKLTGTDSHKCNTVAVCFIHICLDLKDESREGILHRIDHAHICFSRKRGGGHLQEMLQEDLHTEVGQGGSEEYR